MCVCCAGEFVEKFATRYSDMFGLPGSIMSVLLLVGRYNWTFPLA